MSRFQRCSRIFPEKEARMRRDSKRNTNRHGSSTCYNMMGNFRIQCSSTERHPDHLSTVDSRIFSRVWRLPSCCLNRDTTWTISERQYPWTQSDQQIRNGLLRPSPGPLQVSDSQNVRRSITDAITILTTKPTCPICDTSSDLDSQHNSSIRTGQ